MRGSGKSWTSAVVAEELAKTNIPFIVVDLMGEYKTLREKFPILIVALGTPKYADITNLSEEQAAVLAERIVQTGISVVLDLKHGTMLKRYAFLAKFLEGFYRVEEKVMKPYVLILDEAHRITPEKGVIKLRGVRDVQTQVEYWVYEIGATGRHYGIGFVAVARRTAEISKMTLTQCELKIVHKVSDPIDLDKLREYGLSSELLVQVERFRPGDAVVIGLEKPKIIHVKPRICSHGAKTPLAKPIETPNLAKAIQELTKLIKAPPAKPTQPPKSTVKPKEMQRLRRELEQLRTSHENLREWKDKLTERVGELEAENERLREELKASSKIREVFSQLIRGELERLEREPYKKATTTVVGLQSTTTIADVPKAVKHVTISDETIRGKVLRLAKDGFLDKWRGLGDIHKALIEQFGWTVAKSSLQVELNRMVDNFMLGAKKDLGRKQRVYKLAANVAFKKKEVEA
jgi:DNA helicase HerA-like ATPase